MKSKKTSSLADNLKHLLKVHHLSISCLAKETFTKPNTLHGYLNGVHPQSLEILKRIADRFDIKLDDLVFSPIQKSSSEASLSHEKDSYIVTIEIQKVKKL